MGGVPGPCIWRLRGSSLKVAIELGTKVHFLVRPLLRLGGSEEEN